MKRSEINAIIAAGDAFIRSFGYVLPPFAYWAPDRLRSAEGETIRERGLGWDVTDYGKGRFEDTGLFLFTARNGSLAELTAGQGMLYAEKIMISRDGQFSPTHRHIRKTEDIVNRGGGDLVLSLFASDASGGMDRQAEVRVPCDGVDRRVEAGGQLRLKPGESVTLFPGIWHAFWAEGRDCLIGEISTINDDRTDNVFEEPLGRFSHIAEDTPPSRLLVADY